MQSHIRFRSQNIGYELFNSAHPDSHQNIFIMIIVVEKIISAAGVR